MNINRHNQWILCSYRFGKIKCNLQWFIWIERRSSYTMISHWFCLCSNWKFCYQITQIKLYLNLSRFICFKCGWKMYCLSMINSRCRLSPGFPPSVAPWAKVFRVHYHISSYFSLKFNSRIILLLLWIWVDTFSWLWIAWRRTVSWLWLWAILHNTCSLRNYIFVHNLWFFKLIRAKQLIKLYSTALFLSRVIRRP